MFRSEAPAAGSEPQRTPPSRARKPRRTQAERTDETRGKVLDAAVAVLRSKGYAGLRTDEVARVAQVSRGAMQYHFETKDSLVLAAAEHLLRDGLDRGCSRARAAVAAGDPFEAIIQDCLDFFLGPDFSTVLDLVLAGSKDQALREQIYAHTRASRLGVEAAWLDVLCEHGIARDKAESLLWLTVSVVRGFSVRALWQRDDARFRELLDDWKQILASHLQSLKADTP